MCLAVRLPECWLHQHPDQRFAAHRSLLLLSRTAPFARTGLSLPGNDGPFRNLHSRIDVPDLILRSYAGCLLRPFGLAAPPPLPVRPGRGGLRSFWPVASPTACASDLLHNLHSPFGIFPPVRIKAFGRFRQPCGTPDDSARSPLAPRGSLSLSSANCYGSSFLVRYVLAGLLFLKPLGTFFTMNATAFFVNDFCGYARVFSSGFIFNVSSLLQIRNRELIVEKTGGSPSVLRY